ncbi:PKD domain-containing protein [Corynebacterium sp. P6145]|uniref:PKD domain-containing protein n=1 Tax=Corynebacterium antarcticum TaxID=2800405 RepID=UPI0020067678|nr:PKD domain-containing protein [Corynebacterium antarcticum]MCK7642315.1 PKD domain-containing protein [Corynebacterium antarcticum]MCX7491796.1 PKD domain-containing protein [Corynebacterium antarcticum]
MSRSRTIRTLLALVVAGAASVGGTGIAAAQTATSPRVPLCPEPVVLTARGSGSQFSGRRQYPGAAGPSTGWEGTAISRLLERADLHGFSVRALGPEEYPAVEAWRLGELVGSVEQGRRSAVRRVADLQAGGCQPVVIPVGYSQGALVFNGAERALSDAAHLPGVLYLGNPLRDGRPPRNTGSAPPVPGRAVPPVWPWETARSLNAPGQEGIDYCYRNDVFCDPAGTSVEAHLSYFTGIPGEDAADRAVADTLSAWTAGARARLDGGERVAVTRPVDEILLIDTAEPVESAVLAELARGIPRIMDAVTGANPDSRVGVAVVRDGVNRWLLPPTRDAAAVAATLTDPAGRPVGDVIADPEPDGVSTRNMITVAGTEVSVGRETVGRAAAGTADAVLTVVSDHATAPNAVLDAPGIWFAGQPAGVTGMLSRVFADGPVHQRLDFGDGTVVDSAGGNYVEHVWRNPGTYLLTLTVTDSRGRTGVDRRWVRVYSGDVAAELDAALRAMPARSGSTGVEAWGSTG